MRIIPERIEFEVGDAVMVTPNGRDGGSREPWPAEIVCADQAYNRGPDTGWFVVRRTDGVRHKYGDQWEVLVTCVSAPARV